MAVAGEWHALEVLRGKLGIERPPDLREERRRAKEERRLAREAREARKARERERVDKAAR
jgi:hypothetical protein